ncbi:MAG: ATP-binding cassette domain-containing protein, partial [Patescibacteria group bacterium]
MAWQNPVAIPGLNVEEFLIKILRLHASANHQNISLTQARQEIFDLARQIGSMDILKRDLNDGLSGGEKKRLEVIQMAAVKPKLALVDEIDSGLDAGSLLKVSKLIRQLNKNGTAFLIVSHHFNLLRKVKVDQVNFLAAGRLVKQTRLASLRQLK